MKQMRMSGYFPECDDGEKVIPLGDGFLGGEAYLQNGDERST